MDAPIPPPAVPHGGSDAIARFFDLTLDMLAVASVETGRFVRAGSGFGRVLGWSEGDLVETPFMDLVHPDDLGASQEALGALAAGDDLVAFENRALCKDGTHRWVEWQIAPDPGAGLIYAAGRDVTDRRRREANLAVLADLADDLAQVSSEADVFDAVGARLGGHLGDVSVHFTDVDAAAETVTIQAAWGNDAVVGVHALGDFLNEAFVEGARAGETAVVRDVYADPRATGDAGAFASVGIGAFVTVPTLRDGVWTHLFVVTADGARDWRADEVALVEEVAARVVPRVERARAEAEVQESEERYRTLFESVTVGFCIVDLVYDESGRPVDYCYLEVNPTFEAQTGLSNVEGRCVSEVIPGLEPYWFEMFGRVAETGEPARRLDHAAPLGRWFDVYATRVGGPGSRRVALLFTDVTEQKEAERAVLESEARFRGTFENAAVGIAHVGLDGTWLDVNERLCEIVGYAHDELLGLTFQDITHSDDLGLDLEQFERLLAGEIDHYQMEKRYVHQEGRTVWIHLTVSPNWGGGGEPDYVISVVEDISDKKAGEDALRALNDELEDRVEARTAELARSNAELDQFAYVASHDLKAPLRAIDSLAAWIDEDAGDRLPLESARHLGLLRARVARMEGLLDGLLAYSRAGRAEAEPEPVDTAALVREVAETVAPPEGFDVRIEGDFPVVVTARAPLALVLRNLVSNAIKHHDRPGGRVTVSAEADGGWAAFTVEDDGPGVPPEYRDRVFGLFQTLRPRDEVEGSGMGLAIVKKTIESRGGRITLETPPGGGARFRFTWPLSAVAPPGP